VVILKAIDSFQVTLFEIHTHAITINLTAHALIVLGGGLFIIYTAVKEITHMLSQDDLDHEVGNEEQKKSAGKAIATIVVMNLVFSFDSILSAIALTKVVWVMSIAIIVSGLLMIALANTVSEFLKKNRMFEVLGLFILLIVGIMLLSEGGHLAHLSFFNYPIEAMSKATFYFSIVIVVIVDIAQTRYQKKLDAERDHTTENQNA
jgi:predicted tellurium resistance membrane protein TerC